MILFLLTAVVLILLILIQKGRGGGLAGAFGGPGGHSAFGTKTADIFIKATAVLGAIFFLLSIATAWVMRPEEGEAPPEPAPVKEPADAGTGGADVPDDEAAASDDASADTDAAAGDQEGADAGSGD